MRANRFAGVACVLFAAFSTPAFASEVADKLKALETLAWEAWKQGDKDAYAALTGEPAVKVSSAGIVAGKDDFVGVEIPENCGGRDFALDSMEVHKITDKVYAVTYAAQLTQTCNEAPADHTLHSASVWVEQDGNWKTVLLSEADVLPPPVD